MDEGQKDFISALPDSLLCQILSNLSTKEAGSTSLLSKRWRYLFAHVTNLDFDDLHLQDNEAFVDFVDRVLELRGEDRVDSFSLKCGRHFWGTIISSWISNVLSHGVSYLSLHFSPQVFRPLPSTIFVSETLVSLKIGPEDGPTRKLKKVCLPKLKILNLDSCNFKKDEICFAKLLSGCPVLEELRLPNLGWDEWDSCSVSSKTVERLILCTPRYDTNPKSVSFDTPNVVYLEYSDYIADKYPILNFDSLVEAHLAIRMTEDQKRDMRNASDDNEEETDIVANVTMFLMGISNVKKLYISYKTLETLNYCCEAIPIFNNLTHLTIDSHSPLVGWEALPNLLKNCPNLETLGLHHEVTDGCGSVCLCGDMEKTPSSLSHCPVKFLSVMNFCEAYDSDDDEREMEKQFENIKNFLKKMPNLEQLIVYYNSPIDDYVAEVSSLLEKVEKVATRKCEIQVISDRISFSSTVPISLPMKLGKMLL